MGAGSRGPGGRLLILFQEGGSPGGVEISTPTKDRDHLSPNPARHPFFLQELSSPDTLQSVCAQDTQRGGWWGKDPEGLQAGLQLSDQVRAGVKLCQETSGFQDLEGLTPADDSQGAPQSSLKPGGTGLG